MERQSFLDCLCLLMASDEVPNIRPRKFASESVRER